MAETVHAVSYVYILYTDKKENKTFLIYKEIQIGSGAKSYMNEEGAPNI